MNALVTDRILANLSIRTAESFRERVEAAAAAGFDAIGLGLAQYREHKAEGMTPREMVAILEDNGIALTEIEVLVGFAVGGRAGGSERYPFLKYATPEDELEFFEMATTFGVRHMQTIGTFDSPLEPDAAERFAGLCDRAAEHGLLVALEFVPESSVPDASVAARIIRDADRPNGGVCLDAWHHFRGANDEALLRELPADKVFLLQLCDGTMVPEDDDFLNDTLHNRRVPGQGEFDLPALFRVVGEMGVSAPASLEVISDELDALGAFGAAKALGGCLEHYRID